MLAAIGAIVGYGGTLTVVWAAVAIAVFALTGWGLVHVLWLGKRFPWHPCAWPMLGFAAVVAVQWLARRSAAPSDTLTQFLQLAMYGCAFWLALWLFQDDACLRRTGWGVWAFSGVLAVEAILQTFTANRFIYWFHDATYAWPVGPFVYHNHFAGCMELLFPLATVVAFRPPHGPDSPWLTYLRRGLVPLFGLASILVAQSRGGLLCILVEVVLLWLLLMRTGRKRRLVVFGVGMGLFATLLLAVNWQPILSRFQQLTQHDPSAADRLQVAQACWAIFRDHPLLGAGFGSFPSVYPRYMLFDNGLTWDEAHDDYVQTLAETGLAGSAMVLLFLILYGLSLAAGLRRLNQETGRWRMAAAIGTLGLLLHSVGDFQFHSPANALLFFILAGYALSTPPRRRSPKPAPFVAAGVHSVSRA